MPEGDVKPAREGSNLRPPITSLGLPVLSRKTGLLGPCLSASVQRWGGEEGISRGDSVAGGEDLDKGKERREREGDS